MSNAPATMTRVATRQQQAALVNTRDNDEAAGPENDDVDAEVTSSSSEPQRRGTRSQKQAQQQDGTQRGGGTVATMTEAVGVPQKLVDDFSKQYQLLVFEASTVEQSAKDIRRIVDVNFNIYKLLSSFLEAIRAYANSSTIGKRGSVNSVVVSVHDLDALENERELRLLRSIVASNAETVGLGNSFLASIDPANLKRSIVDALNNVANKQGGGSGDAGSKNDDGDDTAEEKRPESVNLDDNGGLYAIRPTDDALSLDRLIGYQDEAREIVSFCRRVDFVVGGQPSANKNAETGQTKQDLELVPRNPVVVILYGPPGTGKTTIAQSVAKYLNCVYMYVNAENVTSQWAGGTEKNIAKLFRRARIASRKLSTDSNKPRTVLLLIDEIDGLVKNRATSLNLTGEEYNRITTFLQMLTPPIGVNNSNIICIFTTNRLDNIDAAIVNRARGQIFMGYVVAPKDRIKLVGQIFRDYVNGDIDADPKVSSAAIRCDDLVPRDLQNILARVKNKILSNYVDRTSGDARRDVVINLSEKQNRISLSDLAALLNESTPGTDAAVLFRDYAPPQAHVCRWLVENGTFANVCRSYSAYKAHGRNCKVAN